MKIPTIVGLALLIIATSLGVAIFYHSQNQKKQALENLKPLDIKVANITDAQAAVIWQTAKPAVGSVTWGPNFFVEFEQGDDRDKKNPSLRVTHFVTLKNLSADTKYFFQIQNDKVTFPKKALKLKTAKKTDNQSSILKPIWGIALDENLQPVDEATILLEGGFASSVATFSTTGGNYILPLTNLRDKNFQSLTSIPENTLASLSLSRADLKANVKLNLPSGKDPLPPVILGEDLDLTEEVAEESPPPGNIYDLNKDGQINSLDLGILLNNYGREPHDQEADFNEDGVVDLSDVDLFKDAMSKNSINQQI